LARYQAQNSQNGTNYFSTDAKTFAEWGVDSFKFGGCNEDPHHFDDLYPKMGKALNESGLIVCQLFLKLGFIPNKIFVIMK